MTPPLLEPLKELPHAMLARDWDLHVERAGGLGRAAAGEPAPLWVASVSRADFALEAQGRSPAAALEALWAEVCRHARLPHREQARATARRGAS